MKLIIEVERENKKTQIVELDNLEEAIEEIGFNVYYLLIDSDFGDGLYDDINNRDFEMLEYDLKLGYPISMKEDIEAFVKTVKQIFDVKEKNELPTVIESINRLYERFNEPVKLSFRFE